MANPIDGTGRPAGPPLQESRDSRQVREPAGQPPTNDAPTEAGERSAASESERLQAVREAVDQAPEVDRERVDALREQIANGDYPLNAESIAERFAELEGLLES